MAEWIVTDPLNQDKVIADNIIADTEKDAASEFVNLMGYEIKEDDR